MGKLGKAFGIEKKGKIGITVQKPSYIAGELVCGTIYVDIHEPIQCDALILKATGKEKVEWTESRTVVRDGQSETVYDTHDSEKEFFKQKIVICAISQTYAPGRYMYPFEYQLPPNLPGVFEMNSYSSGSVSNLSAKIKYKFKATLDVGGYFSSDLKANCNLVVHERLFTTITASEDSVTQNVKFLCCFDKGTCHLAATMDKNVYLSGETANIQCHINNQSQVDITFMRCHLYQDVTLQLKHGGRRTFTNEICVRKFSGVPAGSSLQQPQPIMLVPDHGGFINPTTTGSLIACAYRIDVECDIPWCPDVQLHLPITIIAPEIPNVSWVPQSTDGYIQPL